MAARGNERLSLLATSVEYREAEERLWKGSRDELAEYLRQKLPQFNFLNEAIDLLERAREFHSNSPHAEREAIERDAGNVLACLNNILRLFYPRRKRPRSLLPGYISLSALCEHWSTILGWMKYLAFFGRWEDRPKYVGICVSIMLTVTSGGTDDPYQCDILGRDASLDLVILLLTSREKDGNRPIHINVFYGIAGPSCMIIKLFYKTPAKWMANRLNSMSQRTRRAVMSSLVKRGAERACYQRSKFSTPGSPFQVVASELSSAIRNIMLLSLSILHLSLENHSESVDRKRFFSTYAKEVHDLAILALQYPSTDIDGPVWEALGMCAKAVIAYAVDLHEDPTPAIVGLVTEGSILRTPWTAVYNHTESFYSRHIVQVVQFMQPFLYISSIFNAIDRLDTSSGMPWWIGPSPASGSPDDDGPFVRVRRGWTAMLDWSRSTYIARSNRYISICCNSKHWMDPSHGDKPSLQECGRCRVALYCSTQCQKQDWPVHKAECTLRLSKAGGQSDFDVRVPFKTRRDQLRILDTVVNLKLPSSIWSRWSALSTASDSCQGVGPGTHHPPTCRCSDSTPIITVDFAVISKDTTSFDVTALHTRLSDSWAPAAIEPYRPRLREWTSSIVQDPTRFMMVEGTFRLSSKLGVSLLAYVECVPHAPEGERYNILSNISFPFKNVLVDSSTLSRSSITLRL
ncbi:hypothetical protein NMY22_g15648 [Coprinellus aureogranulatus]|nr:hypothetical protein NMY22_g15648 [Coprinellus aureogranulatus]